MQAEVDNKKEVQPPHQGVVEAVGPENPPKQKQVEREVNGRKDQIPPAIIQPGRKREDTPFSALDSVHLVGEYEGEGYKKEEYIHIFTC